MWQRGAKTGWRTSINKGRLWCCVTDAYSNGYLETSLLWRRQVDHVTVACLVAWSLNESEPGGKLVLIETSLLFLGQWCCSLANSWFSLKWWDSHIGVQNNGKMLLKFCIIIESKSFFTIVLYTNMAAVMYVTWKPRISRNLHKKNSEVSIKTRSPPASFSFKGQAT